MKNEYRGQQFNEDTFIAEEMSAIIERNGIGSAFETGTFEGETTYWFSLYGGGRLDVVSCEIDDRWYGPAKEKLKNRPNVQVYQQNSPECIRMTAPGIKQRILFFLDAHWYNENPIFKELNVISRLVMYKLIAPPVITIHDWCVPGATTLGYDLLDPKRTSPLQLADITPVLEGIYGENNYSVHYNSDEKSTGAKRGIIYVEPII